jgi:sterol desaturase/sphingolipid hydroxylase (fatty acid hydroxylase superfamily)
MSDDPERAGEPSALRKVNQLASSHGALEPGKGLVSGVVALCLAMLAVLAVLAMRFPAYLTTPELRHAYDVATLRYLLFGGMVLAGALAITNIVLGRKRWLSAWAFGFLVVAQLLGGPGTPIEDFPDHTPYVGLDFFVLDLLGSTLVFVFIEKLFPLKKDQPVFRPEWQNDLVHFFVNHLFVGLTLVVTNRVVHELFGWAVNETVQGWTQHLHVVVQVFLVILAADLVQYWAHRAYHEVPFLWRFHSVHHSAKHMDWLAGSRQSIVELIVTRIAVLTPIFVLGFSETAINVYVVVVGFQAVFNHANVSVRLGPLRYLIVTPNFHHWHHSQDTEAIDRNYAAHFALLDHLFGTAVQSDRKWPERYGVVGDYVPLGFFAQQAFPFVGSTETREQAERGDPHTAAGKKARASLLPVPPMTSERADASRDDPA